MLLSRKRIAVAVVLVALVALYAVDPSSAWWVPKCPFKLLTGWSCPACGIQRFAHALLRGHIAEALRYNYYLIYALPYAALFAIEWLMPPCAARDRLASVIENRYAVGFYVATFLIWLVARNLLGI